MYTEIQLNALNARRILFCQEIFYISDASPREVETAGWKTKGKEAWLAKTVSDFRKDVHKILDD